MARSKRAPKLTPPDDPLALMNAWEGFHTKVMAEFTPKGRILFMPSCSGDKPYACSPSHRSYQALLDQIAPGQIDKVTLSGILGPVPESMEELVASEYNYNFYLNRYAHLKGQLPLLTERLVQMLDDFLTKFGPAYDLRVSFSRENYRKVMVAVAARQIANPVVVLPRAAETSLEKGIAELEDLIRLLGC